MPEFLKISLICISLIFFSPNFVQTTDDRKLLRGSWQAETLISGGKDVSQENAEYMQFTFDKDKLVVKGNFGKNSIEECAYKIDSSKTPKHLDILPPSQSKPVLGIYELNDDKLKICIRRTPSGERPKNFDAKSDADLTLVIFKKQK